MSAITVRPIKLRDLFRLRGVCSEAESILQPPGRIGHGTADPWSALPVSRRAHKSYVALEDGQPIAILDLRADPENHRWIITRMAATQQFDDFDDHTREITWQELLIHAVRAAGAARAKRIHAAFPEDAPVIDTLTEVGFSKYSRDSVMKLAHRLPRPTGDRLTRKQESSDVWSIHQLYHSVTPRPVQYAEALTSNYWDGAVPGSAPGRGYVIENGFEIAAHCRVISRQGRHVLSVMVHPDALELLDHLVHEVVDDISHSRSDDVIVCIPGYLQEYVSRLDGMGFEVIGQQIRLVKYTVVPRRMQLRSVEELGKEFPERVAAGTPTFYLAGEQQAGPPRETSKPD